MVQACVGQSVYIYGSTNGSNPNTGYFTTNAPLIVNTTVIRVSICDVQSTSNYFPLDAIQVGGTIIFTARLNDSVKFIFKVTSILPPYIINSVVQSFNYNVQFLWGSQYNPTENYDEFYIDFGIVDTMRPYCPPYMLQGNFQQNAIVPCPPVAPTTCGCSKPHCNCHNHPHPQHVSTNCHPSPPQPPSPSDEVLNTYKSTGSFLYRYDSNYGAATNPVLTDAAAGTFRINGSSLDSSTFIQMSTTDGSPTPYNNASYLNSISAGSTLTLYNVTTGKRCIFKLSTSASQETSTVSTATQTNANLYGSYAFKVTSISTDYGITLTQGDSYIVTFTISSGSAGAALAALENDILPGGPGISLGSLFSTFKDIYIGPNSLYISSYKLGCDASGNIVLSNTASGPGAPPPFKFDFVANTIILQNISTVLSPAALTTLSTIVSGSAGSNLSTITSGTAGSNLTTITSGTSGSNLSTFVASISNPTTSANLSTLTTGTSGSNLSTLVASSSNVSTAGSVLSAAATEGKILAKVAGGINYDWVTPPPSVVFDNKTIISTAGIYSVSSNISTAGSVLAGTATEGKILAKTAGGINYDWVIPPPSAVFDNKTIISTAGIYSVGSNISTAGSYLGNVAPDVSSITSIISSTATTGYLFAKTGPSAYGWQAPPAGGTSITFDNTIIQTGATYGVASNISTVASVISSTATTGYLLAKTGPSAYGWQAPPVSGLVPITVNVVYSNTTGSPQPWYYDSDTTTIVVNSNLTIAATTLPTGWSLYTAAANTRIGLRNSSLTAAQMTPVSLSVSYAKDINALSNASSWRTYVIDHSGLQPASGGLISAAGDTGLIIAVPQPTLDSFTLLQRFAIENGLSGTWGANSALGAIDIPGSGTAQYVKFHFLFNLAQ